ncbi:hypothetical protein KAR26_01190 [Candidatus Parcubacteria bacterium]|nr:hypothetical protein [Candidatus Parcubacteria bacterium]
MNKKVLFSIFIIIVLCVCWYVMTLDWRGNDAKTFYNAKHSFSFEYPPHWYVTGDEMADIIQLSTVEQESGDGGLPLGMRVEIIVSENSDKIDLEDWVDAMSREEVINRETITIGGMSALKEVSWPLFDDEGPPIIVYIAKDASYIVQINYLGRNPDYIENMSYFEQLLDSFKIELIRSS